MDSGAGMVFMLLFQIGIPVAILYFIWTKTFRPLLEGNDQIIKELQRIRELLEKASP